jgi:hypothetical protein
MLNRSWIREGPVSIPRLHLLSLAKIRYSAVAVLCELLSQTKTHKRAKNQPEWSSGIDFNFCCSF